LIIFVDANFSILSVLSTVVFTEITFFFLEVILLPQRPLHRLRRRLSFIIPISIFYVFVFFCVSAIIDSFITCIVFSFFVYTAIVKYIPTLRQINHFSSGHNPGKYPVNISTTF
jgi:hypothetical protein